MSVTFLDNTDRVELETLIDQVRDEIPKNATVTDGQIAAAVEAYFAENPIEIPGGSAGITTAQINALDELFRIAAYTKDASEKYAAFRVAFGLDGSAGEDDGADSTDWELVRVVGADEIVYGKNIFGNANNKRASYYTMDIPVGSGYKYKITVDYTGTDVPTGSAVIAPKSYTEMPTSGIGMLFTQGFTELDETGSFEITVTEETISAVSLLGWLAFSYEATTTFSSGIQSVTITRKAVS